MQSVLPGKKTVHSEKLESFSLLRNFVPFTKARYRAHFREPDECNPHFNTLFIKYLSATSNLPLYAWFCQVNTSVSFANLNLSLVYPFLASHTNATFSTCPILSGLIIIIFGRPHSIWRNSPTRDTAASFLRFRGSSQ